MNISTKSSKLTTLCLALTLGTFGVTAPLWASVIIEMDLEALVEESDSIIEGRVETAFSQWDGNKRLIFTFTSIRVADPLKGERKRSLLVKQLGGKVGSLNMTVAGTPKFKEDSNVIVFLKDAGDGTFHVTGMNQGNYEIIEEFAISNLSGVDLLNLETGLISETSRMKTVRVDLFKQSIRELLR